MLNLHVWLGIPFFFIWVHSILAGVSLGWITKRMPVVWRRSGFLNHKRAHFIRKSNNVQHFCKLNPVWPAGTLKILQEAVGTINHNRVNFYAIFWNNMQLHNFYKGKQSWGMVEGRSLFVYIAGVLLCQIGCCPGQGKAVYLVPIGNLSSC